MTKCVFCKIVRGELPSTKLFENDSVLAFLDIAPINKGHSLIIPKEHYENIYDLPEEEFKEIVSVAKKLAPAIKKTVNADGINLLQSNEGPAGQEVMHSHLHIIPRFKGDGSGFKWLKKEYKEGEMEELQEKIKSSLK